jgi:hypothetical protein
MRQLQNNMVVRDLNSESFLGRMLHHEFRPLCSLSGSRPHPLGNTQTSGSTLRCRGAGETFRMSPATHLHGLRAVDMARGAARHRRLLERQAGGALPLWVSRPDCQIDTGRRQRTAGLAAVGGAGQKSHAPSQGAVCRRGLGSGIGSHPLRWTPPRSICP